MISKVSLEFLQAMLRKTDNYVAIAHARIAANALDEVEAALAEREKNEAAVNAAAQAAAAK